MTDEEIIEAFKERAAIIELLGKRDPVNAAKMAGGCIRKQFGRVPDCVLVIIKETEIAWERSQEKST